ncbi:MAG: hypothetical protein HXM33_01365 [Haemophilus sp.]|nr:hypothetical protein [Haemophilus sp.]
MSFDTTVKEFAEFMGSEIKRVETEISTGGSQSTVPIIYGAGRPDKPDTTDGKIKGNEPNGTIYSSLDGAGVGAYLWQKQKNQWIVISGDTGNRIIRSAINIKSGFLYLQRINNLVICSFTGGAWSSISFYGKKNPEFKRKTHAKRFDLLRTNGIPEGFRTPLAFMLPFYSDDGVQVGMVYVGGTGNYNYIELRFTENVQDNDFDLMRLPVITWVTNDPFPNTLP